ncbi:hypothetical protein DRN74_01825 [Candidatus Micrarchaeota archaeon]|nr:MAG: hypothetical protein DRN74_01825 [Candidatus Micrarchaeota archaeon]
MDNRAQISIEMLLVAGALFAVAVLVVSSLTQSSKEASDKMSAKVSEVLEKIDKMTEGAS